MAGFPLNKRRVLRAIELVKTFAICKRYELDRNALRFTVQTLKALPGRPDAGRRRLVFFAHYDPQDEVDEYVRFYLQSLYELGSTIVFVSGSPNLKADSAEKIAPYCAGIFTRKTLSLDFGSWHLAWQHARKAGWRLEDFDEFLLANDSVYGPLFDLREMFASFTGADMYGVTENLEYVRHLQSYFLLWELNDRTRPFLEEFWSKFLYIGDKQKLIDKCELGISTAAAAKGLRLKAYIPDAAVRAIDVAAAGHEHAEAVKGRAVNNTLYFWDVIISELRCPFLKTEMLKRNRYGSTTIREVVPFLKRWTNYDTGLIERHLKRIGFGDSLAE